MFLKNFYMLAPGAFDKKYHDVSVVDTSGNTVTAKYDTNYITSWFPTYIDNNSNIAPYSGSLAFLSNETVLYYNTSSVNYDVGKWGVILGDGDTAPTVSDYSLSGNIITDFTGSTSILASASSESVSIIANYTLTNTGATAFTVKEIGITRKSSSYSPVGRVLLIRDVLSTPVTIAPGDTGVVTYKIEIS